MDFMPHGYCLRWDHTLVFWMILTNGGIAVAYFAIPAALWWFIGARQDLPYRYMFGLFSAFIVACGTTHLVKILTLYYPWYWIEVWVDGYTALISVITACLLAPLIPRALKLRSPEELQEVNDALSTANVQLAAARDAALENSRLKSAFVANISHELRTPLSGIIGINELMLSGELSDELRQMSRTISESAKALLNIVNDLLDISKMEAGKISLHKIPINLHNLVTSAMKLLATKAKVKRLDFTLQYDYTIPDVVLADPDRIKQVLVNLLSNALKFTDRGGVVVTTKMVGGLDGNVDVLFSIQDTGIGIDQEHLSILFQPFSQIDNSTTRRFSGTGLGLNVSKAFVELMGGEIGVESVLGQGSRFWFQLPLQTTTEPTPSEPLRPIEDVSGLLAGKKILVVEDNQTLQVLTIKQLECLGNTPTVVGNGLEAIESVRDQDYDLVLMDCHLPEMDGFEATRIIRAIDQERSRKTCVMAMTAAAMSGDAKRCYDAGMDDYLVKPVTLAKLVEHMKNWLKEAP